MLYTSNKIELLKKKEINKNKISEIINIYEILIPYLKEKSLITKIIDLKNEIETIELSKECDKLFEKLNINDDNKII